MNTSFLTGAALTALFFAPTLPAAAAVRVVGAAAPTQSVDFIVSMPLRNANDLESLVSAQSNPNSPIYHHFLTAAQFRASYAPSAQTVRAVSSALASQGFAVTHATAQTLAVRGRVANVERAFGVRMQVLRHDATQRIATSDHVRLPAALAQTGAQVLGLENEHRKRVHSYRTKLTQNRYSNSGPYWWDDLKQAYTAPSYKALDGSGASIAIVISSDILDADLATAFNHEKFSAITGKPVPTVHREPILGGAPFDPNNPGSFEAALDTQMSLGTAPGATEWLYNIPDLSDASVMAADSQIVDDNKVDVVSSSFGECELFYTASYNGGVDQTSILQMYHQIFLQGNALGITFVASSGDSSGLGCPTPDYLDPKVTTTSKFVPGVEFPASDTAITGVGGTNLITTAPASPQPVAEILKSKYVSESEFADTEIPYDPYSVGKYVSGGLWGAGSGTSAIFKKPLYQYLVQTHAPRRAVPDVSLQMGGCPGGISLVCQPNDSAAVIAFGTGVGGGLYGVIGTSASAPEFAGTLALEVQRVHSRLGNVNYALYAESALNDAFGYHFFHQGIPGYNGIVTENSSWRGYSRILGVGTLYTSNAFGAHDVKLAGDPQTPSNP